MLLFLFGLCFIKTKDGTLRNKKKMGKDAKKGLFLVKKRQGKVQLKVLFLAPAPTPSHIPDVPRVRGTAAVVWTAKPSGEIKIVAPCS